MQIIEITDAEGRVVESGWLARAERVHRELRPQIPPPYTDSLGRVFSGGGRMIVAVDHDAVLGTALFRVYDNTAARRKLYIDDLVVAEAARSRGVGRTMLERLESEARRLGCTVIELDSGTYREAAHRFYFRAGYTIQTFGFRKAL